MTTPEMSWSETLIAAGMEPELAKAFDLIELRTPDSRAVSDITVALLRVHEDVESLKSELESVLERMANLESSQSALAQLLGELILELRTLRRHIDDRFDALTNNVEALNGVVAGNGKAIQRLDASLEVLHAKVREVDRKAEGIDERVRSVEERVQGIDERVQRVEERVQGIDERVQRVEETQNQQGEALAEILAWVRTQRDAG